MRRLAPALLNLWRVFRKKKTPRCADYLRRVKVGRPRDRPTDYARAARAAAEAGMSALAGRLEKSAA